MTENSRISLNVFATYGRSLLAAACGIFTARWVLMILGDSDYGMYGVVGGLTVFIAVINGVLASSVSRYYAYYIGKSRDVACGLEECQRWFSLAVFIHLIIPVLLLVVGYPLGMYCIEHALSIPSERLWACKWIFRLACIACLASMIGVPCRAMYVAKQYIAELTIYSLATTILNVVVLYLMTLRNRDWLIYYAAWMCISVAVPEIVIMIRALFKFRECRFRLVYCRDWMRLKKLFSYAMWQLFGAVGSVMRTQGMQLVINKNFGLHVNASFSVSEAINAQTSTLSVAIMNAFQPAIGSACGAGNKLRMQSLSITVCKFGSLATMLFAIPLSFELDYVLKLWLKAPPIFCGPLTICVLIAAVVEQTTIGHMLAVNANGRIALYQSVVGGLLILAVPVAVLMIALGMKELAIGMAIVLISLMCAVARVVLACRLIGLNIRQWVMNVVVPIVMVGGVGCLAAGGVVMSMPSTISRVLLTGVLSAVAMISAAYLWGLTNQERKYMSDGLKSIIRRVI